MAFLRPWVKLVSHHPGVRDLLRYSPVLRKIPWEKFYIKDTSKGPMVWEAKAVRVYLKRNGLATRPQDPNPARAGASLNPPYGRTPASFEILDAGCRKICC